MKPVKIVVGTELLEYTCCSCDNTALVVFQDDQHWQEVPAGWKQLYEYIPANLKEEITDNYMCGYCRTQNYE